MFPVIKITDQVGDPISIADIDLSNPSSLLNYLKAEVLHLAVVPDFMARKDSKLSQAAAHPIEFKASVKEGFQLGNTSPEVEVTPDVQVTIRANADVGTDLFDDDPFAVEANVPEQTGYVSVAFDGSLDLGVSGAQGDLTFGIDATASVHFGYAKAFPFGAGEPTLADALVQTISNYVIPAEISDLTLLGMNDVATVSGSGSLQVSGGASVSAIPNPLASASLPLVGGSIAVQGGPLAGLSVAFTISGSYQIRARKIDADTIELSFLREHGTEWSADLSGGAGVSVDVGSTDLVSILMKAISTDPEKDVEKLAALGANERAALAAAIKGGLDHSLQASIDLALSSSADDQAAFQYHVQPAKLAPEGKSAIQSALRGDLRPLTAMEGTMQKGGILAPGLQMMNSLFTKVRDRNTTVTINLLGIVNLLTVSDLVLASETLTDEVTGDVTIKETVTGNRISAIIDPLDRNEALRKAVYDSVMTTASYRAGRAIALPTLTCQQVHFASNQKTSQQNMSDYLTWFCALGLLTQADKAASLAQFAAGGPSSCVLRTSFSDGDSFSMFIDESGTPRSQAYFLEIGRKALRALLDPSRQDIDRLRYQIVDDAVWPEALKIGTSPTLGTLVGISTEDPRVAVLTGDVLVITEWAAAMSQVGAAVKEVRSFVGSADPATLATNEVFKQKSGTLQNKLAGIVKASKMRFDEPWGMVCLYWAAGSPPCYGKVDGGTLKIERGVQPALLAAPHETTDAVPSPISRDAMQPDPR